MVKPDWCALKAIRTYEALERYYSSLSKIMDRRKARTRGSIDLASQKMEAGEVAESPYLPRSIELHRHQI